MSHKTQPQAIEKEEICAIRNSQGLTQEQFGKKLGVSKVTVARWEAGDRACKGAAALKIREFQKKDNLNLTPQTYITSISLEDLSRLNSELAIETLRELLVCEARRTGIPVTAIEISSEEISDGGIDCRIRTEKDIPGSFLNTRTTYFQVKSGASAEPWQKWWVKKELFGKKFPEAKHIGKEIHRCLSENGRYVLVCFGIQLTPTRVSETKKYYEQFFKLCGFSNINIEIWGQQQLIGMLEPFLSLKLKLSGKEHLEFQTVASWRANQEMNSTYYTDANQQELIRDIRDLILRNEASHIRLLGESGIGKTRLALEILTDKNLEPYSLYISNTERFINSQLYNELKRPDKEYFFILVLDGCSPNYCREIWNVLRNRNSKFIIISIDSEDYHSSDEKERIIECMQLSDETISKIIESYTGQKHDTHRWVNECSGSPAVAHMMGFNLKKNPINLLAPLSYKNFFVNLILNDRSISDSEVKRELIVLRYLSLFQKFGFEGPLAEEAKKIHDLLEKNDHSIGWAEFQSIIISLKQRRILQGSSTLFISPKALHIYLWLDFWKNHGRLFFTKDLLNKLTDQMKIWFIKMMSYAHQSNEIKNIIRELLSPNGEFYNFNFLSSKIGLMMLHSLSLVTPNLVLQVIENIITEKNLNRSLELEQGYKDIVYSLEKIAFDPNLFCRSAEALLKLAKNESSHHSNNAKTTFINLYSFAPGLVAPTGTPPSERMCVLENTLSSKDDKIFQIGLEGFRKALSHPMHSGFRVIGAEYQGLRETFPAWSPKSNDEFQTAYIYAWETLDNARQTFDREKRSIINSILIDSARYLLYFEWMRNTIFKTLNKLILDEATELNLLVEMIFSTCKYRAVKLPKEVINELKKIDEQITGSKLTSRLKRFILYSGHYNCFDETGKNKEKLYSIIRKIAKECNVNTKEFLKSISLLVKNSNSAVFNFGYELSKIDKKLRFLPIIIENYKKFFQEATHMLFAGYLKAIFESDIKNWESLIQKLIEDENFLKIIGPIVRDSGFTDFAIELLIVAYDKKAVGIDCMLSFYHSGEIKSIKTDNIIAIAQRFRDSQKVENAVDLMNYVFCDKNIEREFPEAFIMQLLKEYCNSHNFSDISDHCCNELAEALIHNNPEKKAEIFEAFFNRATRREGFMGSNNPIYKTIESIIISLPSLCWGILSSKLESCDELDAWRFTLWFNSVPLSLNSFPQETILDWIAESPDKRAKLIAKMVPNTLQAEHGKLGRELLNRYGNQEDVQGAMIENFFSGSWSGSESGYFQEKMKIAQEWLKNENSQRIKNWIEKYIDILSHQMERSLIHEEREL